jgi:hypothetical protein
MAFKRTRAAVLQRHDDEPKTVPRYKVVLLPLGHDESMRNERKWLWPHLGTQYHLMDFCDIEEVPE